MHVGDHLIRELVQQRPPVRVVIVVRFQPQQGTVPPTDNVLVPRTLEESGSEVRRAGRPLGVG